MLTGKNIHKSYGTVQVLKGVDIEIKKGEIVSIVGSSGAGKSTLLHILSTLDKADTGTVEMNGELIGNHLGKEFMAVSWQKRFLNNTLDGLFVSGVSFLLLVLSGKSISVYELGEFYKFPLLIFPFLIPFLYYTLFEWLTGRTPAKYITGSKVFEIKTGFKPTLKKAIFRSLSRFIPLEFFSFFSSNPVGLHDSIAGTIVISSKIPYQNKWQNVLTEKELASFRNRNMGFIFQFHHLLPEFSAIENVCIPGWLAGRRKAEVKQRAEELLKLLGLSGRMENKPNQLSGGEQQRVAVARALINNPDVVFADEPTGNLDSANAEELHKLFLDLRKQFNQTFLIVTHNEELAKLSDRVLHMKDGRIVN